MVIPAGRFDARAVAALIRQPPVCPWRPRSLRLDLRQTFQQLLVILRRRRVPGLDRERGRVPRAAYNRDPLEAFLLRCPNRLPHPGLSLGFSLSFSPNLGRSPALFNWLIGGQSRFAQRRHRFQDSGEEIDAVTPVLNHMFPPTLAVAVTCGRSQLAYRVVVDSRLGI